MLLAPITRKNIQVSFLQSSFRVFVVVAAAVVVYVAFVVAVVAVVVVVVVVAQFLTSFL